MCASPFDIERIEIIHVSRIIIVLCCLSLLSQPQAAWSHALPTRAEPGAGMTAKIPPPHVYIWFDDPLEPNSCTLRVYDGRGECVDNKDCKVNTQNAKLLEVSLPSLPPGTYRVVWSVVSRDGHKTQGDYTFTIKNPD